MTVVCCVLAREAVNLPSNSLAAQMKISGCFNGSWEPRGCVKPVCIGM